MQLQAKENQGLLATQEAKRKAQNRFLLRTLREYDPAGTLSLNFYLPELWENTFLLYWATQFMAALEN